MFAPHVGIDAEGRVGALQREGQTPLSKACGAALGVHGLSNPTPQTRPQPSNSARTPVSTRTPTPSSDLSCNPYTNATCTWGLLPHASPYGSRSRDHPATLTPGSKLRPEPWQVRTRTPTLTLARTPSRCIQGHPGEWRRH